jgi:hypothetical protein
MTKAAYHKTIKEHIIEAIKNFDIASLKELLSDDKSYQDVPKQRFIQELEVKFNKAKRDHCHSFDDVFFGICGSCNKGCEGMTFLSESGYYLDLFIESKDGKVVDDMYVCNQLSNFAELDKRSDLGFQFYKDEEVNFEPDSNYTHINQRYRLLMLEMRNMKGVIPLEELFGLFDRYEGLTETVDKLHPFFIFDFKLYCNIFEMRPEINQILWLKIFKDPAVDGLIDYQLANSEREQLIWFYQNEIIHDEIIYADLPDLWHSSSIVIYEIGEHELSIDISGFEFVLDFLEKLQQFYDDIMEKYKPQPTHLKGSETHEIEYSLEDHLRLHNVHLDIIEKHGAKEGF